MDIKRRSFFKSQREYKDFGLGNRVADQGARFINKDGSFNVEKRGLPFYTRFSYYHALITMPWWKFNLLVFSAYLIANFFFAFVYYQIGLPQEMTGWIGASAFDHFKEAFFFSAQTITTVGYGRVNPIGLAANFVAAAESLVGLLAFALATGLLYGRFSRPVAHILFSDNLLVAPYNKGQTALMFRIANAKNNQITNMTAQVLLSRIEDNNGKKIRRFYTLDLERHLINFLSMSWTIVHPINENSPLENMTRSEIEASDAEIIVILSGFDETFAQNVHARSSYKYNEIVWNAKFNNIFTRSADGKNTIIELDRLNDYKSL